MLITSDFVFVHLPKTGGTFAVDMLKRIYPDAIELEKHGTCSQIPEAYQHLPIVSILRNPFDRYVSQYYYGWWKRHTELYCGEEKLASQGINLASLSFADFIEITDKCFKGYFKSEANGFFNDKADVPLGWHTEQYFRFFFKQPERVFNGLTEQDIENQHYLAHHYPVTFLFNETLNQNLYDYLSELGHDPARIEFILASERILPEGGTPRSSREWQDHFDETLLCLVRERERILFDLFPQYEVSQ